MAKRAVVHGVDLASQTINRELQASDPMKLKEPRAMETAKRNAKGMGRDLVKKAQSAEKAKLKAKLKA